MKKGFLLILAVLTFVYGAWLLPYPHVASDLSLIWPEELKNLVSLPSLWGERGSVGLGEYTAFILWSWPVNFIYGLMAHAGLNFQTILSFLLFVLFLVLGSFTLLIFLKPYIRSRWARAGAVVFYFINSYILLLVDGGQLTLALAYVFLPFAFFLYRKALTAKLREKIYFSLSVALISFFDIRIVYFLLLLIIFDFVFWKLKKPKAFLKVGLVTGFVLIGFHFYWLLPSFLARGPVLPATYGRAAQVDFLSFAHYKHAILMLQPHWPRNVFGQIPPIDKEFLLVPAFAFAAPFLRRKREVYFWVLLALASAFLIKGANPPLPGVYPWLFSHFPGFSLFRDPTKFFFLLALSYTVLIGVAMDELVRKFGKIIPFLFIAYFLFLARPVWLGRMTGTFTPPAYKPEFLTLANKIRADESFSRIFWLPTKAPLGYSSANHPAVEASRLVQKRPFVIGTVGSYETFNFIREGIFMGEIFDIAGIGYLSYPFPDIRREDLKEDNIAYYHAFSKQIENLPWVEKKVFDFPLNVFKTKTNQDRFFVAQNIFSIIGSDRLYEDLVKVPEFRLADNALVWQEEGQGNSLPEQAKIVLFEKKELDLTASLAKRENFIFPASHLGFNPDETGFWKREASDLIWWRSFLQSKYGLDNLDFDYGGGWAVAEDKRELKVQSAKIKAGNLLLARTMQSSKGGRVMFWQGEEKIGEIKTKIEEPKKVQIKLSGYEELPDQSFEYDKGSFSWLEVGELTNDEPLVVKTEGEINVVNSLLSISRGEWEKLEGQTQEMLAAGRVYKWSKLSASEKQNLFESHNKINVSYQRLTPTYYKVKVVGLDSPAMLAFSQTYDSFWQIDKKENSVPLYSLINGFLIDKDGTYEVYFAPQKYVFPGFIISLVTLTFVLTILFKKQK